MLKVFHSIAQIRTNRMFEIGVPVNLNIVRVGSLLCALVVVDLSTLSFVSTLLDRVSTFYTWLLFEFVNVSLASISTLLKFVFNLVDVKFSVQGWPSKSVYIFYADLITDILQMTCYILFMGVFFYQNPARLPIYAIADVVQVARQLATRLQSFRRYREITSNMDTKFPEATAEEMASAESCIICRDNLTVNCKVLACGHIFHTECLKNWAVVQQICPTCRADLVPRPVALTIPSNTSTDEAAKETATPIVSTVEKPKSVSSSLESVNGDSRSVVTSVDENHLLKSIEYAREMAKFYETQTAFWVSEINAIQRSVFSPSEPEGLKQVIAALKADLSGSTPPSLSQSGSSSREDLLISESDWDEIRKTRQRKYEEQLKNRITQLKEEQPK